MKIAKLAAVLLLSSCICSGASSTPAPPPSTWLAATGQFRGDVLEVWVTYDEHRTPEWNPESDIWPMTAKQALALAREGLRTFIGPDEQHFSSFDIRIKKLFAAPREQKTPWCFVIVFESDLDSLREQEVPRGTPPTIPILIFPDGAVKLPMIKKPTKVPE